MPTTSVNTTGPDNWQSYFDEKLEIDYRYFDANIVSVRYEFGFGLSYTTFGLSNAKSARIGDSSVTARPNARLDIATGGNPDLFKPLYNISASVTNTGGLLRWAGGSVM